MAFVSIRLPGDGANPVAFDRLDMAWLQSPPYRAGRKPVSPPHAFRIRHGGDHPAAMPVLPHERVQGRVFA
jgi:hypothetical protein